MKPSTIYVIAQTANLAEKTTCLLGMIDGFETVSPFLHAYQLIFGLILGLIASAIMTWAGIFYVKANSGLVAAIGLLYCVLAGYNLFVIVGMAHLPKVLL